MIANVFIQDMNNQCAKFYTNILTNKDTTNIFPFLAIFSIEFLLFYPKIANFGPIQLGIIATVNCFIFVSTIFVKLPKKTISSVHKFVISG